MKGFFYKEGDILSSVYDGSIRIDSRIDTKGINRGVKNISSSLSTLKTPLSRLASAVGAAFAITSLVKFGQKAVNIASDLTEVQNVVETAFGEMSYQVDKWAKSSIQKFGMSELSAKKTASTYMAMSSGMGMFSQEAANMAIKTAERTADIASFYNVSQEQADTMLKSIWTGETESLKQIGVVMTQTNLDAYALANGFHKTTQEMSQAEQVTLRYNYVMEQTRLAAGDFQKTQGSWANQTRILSEQWNAFMGEIGKSLITVLTPAIQVLNQILSVLISWAQTFSAVVSSLFGNQNTAANQAASSTQAVSSATSSAADSQKELAGSTKKATKELKGQVAAFDELNVLQQSSSDDNTASSPSGTTGNSAAIPSFSGDIGEGVKLSPDVENTINNLKSALKKVVSYVEKNFGPSFKKAAAMISPQIKKLKDNFTKMWTDISTLGEPLKNWFTGDFTIYLQTLIEAWGKLIANLFDTFNMVFSDIWNIVLFPFLQTFTSTILPFVTKFLTQIALTMSVFYETILGIFNTLWSEGIAPALELIMGIWQDLWSSISAAWDKWGAPVFENIRLAIKNVGDIFQTAWDNCFKPIWDNIMRIVDELWTNHLKPLVDNFLDFVGEFVNGALEIYNKFIAPIVKWLYQTLGPVFSKVFNKIADIVGGVIGTVVDIINGLITHLKGIVQFIVGIFTGNWEKAWNGVKNAVEGIWNAIWSAIKGVINLIIGGINSLWSGLYKAVKGIVDTIGGVAGVIGNLLGQDWRFSLPDNPPLIPYLAQGAVIPPNAQFLAMLGDQRHGRNLEAPESLIRQIVREESGAGIPPNITVTAEGDLAALVRMLSFRIDEEKTRIGTSLTKGGLVY